MLPFDVAFPATPPHLGASDIGIDKVWHWFQGQRRLEQRFANVFRQSIDEVLDGQRTGRFNINGADVEKTEKTYLGTKVEIIARAEFELGYGKPMDYLICGIPVDAKFTVGRNWTIPKEAMGHICLLMHADDAKGIFRVGLIRISEENLNLGKNGDQKRTISEFGRAQIRWLIFNGQLPENLLLSLEKADPQALQAIFGASCDYRGSGNGGQLRINELLRRVQGRIIDRTTAVTVASQYDGPKRVRDARQLLRPEGIVVLGHQNEGPKVAQQLGLPVPKKGSWISVSLAKRPKDDPRPWVTIDGNDYVVRRGSEAAVTAPLISQ